MTKLKLKRFKPKSGVREKCVKVSASTHGKLQELSYETGLSMTELSEKLLTFALENTEVDE